MKVFVYSQDTNKHEQRAHLYYEKGDYQLAMEYYLRVVRQSSNTMVWDHLIDSYVQLNSYSEASKWIMKRIKKFGASEQSLFDYALILKRNQNYDVAKKVLQRLVSEYPDKKLYQTHFVACDSVKIWKSLRSRARTINEKKLNSPYSEISPVSFDGGLVFPSSREEILIHNKSFQTNEPYFDLFYSKLVDDSFEKPRLFSNKINSIHHEGPCTFSDYDSSIYFTRSYNYNYVKVGDDILNRLKLYRSKRVSSSWEDPEEFIFNDSTYSFAHPSISQDGQTFFFASDMDGGFGGTDIYVCFKIDNLWTKPMNLGKKVNTSGNESYPYYSEDDELYFASDGHPGYGGMDLFKAIQKDEGWFEIINLKHPINSSADEVGITLIGGKYYFSSNRKGGLGGFDIYSIDIKID